MQGLPHEQRVSTKRIPKCMDPHPKKAGRPQAMCIHNFIYSLDRRYIINMPQFHLHHRIEPKEVKPWESDLWDIIIIHRVLIRIAGSRLCILNEKSSWYGVKMSQNKLEYQARTPWSITLETKTKRIINHRTSWYRVNESLHKLAVKPK